MSLPVPHVRERLDAGVGSICILLTLTAIEMMDGPENPD